MVDPGISRRTHGFTLIELSVVLVIIGLIVGAVLAGRDLIKAAELRSIISQVGSLDIAVNAFKAKYNALPGDMANAQRLWGSKTAGNCTAPTPTYDGSTCNGNGNGVLDSSLIDVYIGYQTLDSSSLAISNSVESLCIWQHLANAGFIEGVYGCAEAPSAFPQVKSRKGVIGLYDHRTTFVYTYETTMVSTSFFTNPIQNWGSHYFSLYNNESYYVLAGEDAYGIDSKIDDGLPGSGGYVRTFFSPCVETFMDAESMAPGDVTAALNLTANYALDGKTIGCPLFIRATF